MCQRMFLVVQVFLKQLAEMHEGLELVLGLAG